MSVVFIVKGRSALELEVDAARYVFGAQPDFYSGKSTALDTEAILNDTIFTNDSFAVCLVRDGELGQGIEAATVPFDKTINFLESEYVKLHQKGRQRLTAMHEVCHCHLHAYEVENGKPFFLRYQGEVPVYRNSEWQSDVWGSAALMPLPPFLSFLMGTKALPHEDKIASISERYLVSRKAAQARLSTVNRYFQDGRLWKILRSLEEAGFPCEEKVWRLLCDMKNIKKY